jgi:ankyrin repeat protein
LAKYHIDRLIDDNEVATRRDLTRLLKTLSKDFSKVYDGVLERIAKLSHLGSSHYRRIMKFLFFISRAREPLSTGAIEHAMAIGGEDLEPDEDFLQYVAESTIAAEDLASRCAGLVTIDERTNCRLVRLAHATIGTYLHRRLMNDYHSPQGTMTKLCLDYMSLSAFSSGAYSKPNAEERALERVARYPFLEYSTRYWGLHAHDYAQTLGADESCFESENIYEKMLTFGADAGLLSTAAQIMRIYDRAGKWDVDRGVSGLHMFAYFGLTEAVRRLLTGAANVNINATDSQDTTALMYSVQEGHTEVTNVLLHADADASLICRRKSTALHRACKNFEPEIWTRLVTLDRDINVNMVFPERYWDLATVLNWSVYRGYIKGIHLLLDRQELSLMTSFQGLRFNSGNDPQCLHVAAMEGHADILDIIIKDYRFCQLPRMSPYHACHECLSPP